MQKETCCINSKAIIDYFVDHNINSCKELVRDLDPEIDALDNPTQFLRDTNNWVSCGVICKLYRRAVRLLNDERAAYHIAKHAVENFTLGYAQRIFIKGFWSSRMVLKHIQQISSKFNRNKRIELVELKNNQAILRLHWNREMAVSKDICLNNQGVITYMPVIWNGKPLILTETSCFFDGAPFCEYHLKWPRRNRLHELFARFFTTNAFLVDSIREMEKDKKIIEQKYEEVNLLNIKLNQKVEQVTAIQETGKAILSILDFDQLLRVIMNIFYEVCRINRAVVMLADEDEKNLNFLQGVGFKDGIPKEICNYQLSLNQLDNILARVTHTGQAEYIAHPDDMNPKLNRILFLDQKPTALFVVPLISRSKIIGVIATDSNNGSGIPVETRNTLEIFASQIAIAIDNARLYSDLQKQMDAVKSSNALLKRAEKLSFLGNMAARLAHEIKNPMTSISTFIQMLPKKFDDEEFRLEFYQLAREETDRVNNLINELLDLVKTRESFFEPVDLHDLIEKRIFLISPQSNAERIRINRHFDPLIEKVWLDPEKIKQTILNILSNAVTFTPKNGIIEVITSLRAGSEDPQQVIIEITDSGPGIPEKIIDRIFDPYFTTRHKSSMNNGTGLGLFIAYQNVQDHGGNIEAIQKDGQGATFRITLPVKEQHKEQARKPTPALKSRHSPA